MERSLYSLLLRIRNEARTLADAGRAPAFDRERFAELAAEADDLAARVGKGVQADDSAGAVEHLQAILEELLQYREACG